MRVSKDSHLYWLTSWTLLSGEDFGSTRGAVVPVLDVHELRRHVGTGHEKDRSRDRFRVLAPKIVRDHPGRVFLLELGERDLRPLPHDVVRADGTVLLVDRKLLREPWAHQCRCDKAHSGDGSQHGPSFDTIAIPEHVRDDHPDAEDQGDGHADARGELWHQHSEQDVQPNTQDRDEAHGDPRACRRFFSDAPFLGRFLVFGIAARLGRVV